MLGGIFSLVREILHAWRESGRNSARAGDSLSMRESWKPCIIIYCSQIVTLSGAQNEVFQSLILQSLLSTANFRESNRQKIFSFSTFNFYGLIKVHTKSFSL